MFCKYVLIFFSGAENVESTILLNSKYLKNLIVYAPSSSPALVAIVCPQWDFILDKVLLSVL
jgi:hypothetical protein